MRKKMHDLRFEYGEMMRNPATTMGDLKKMEQDMMELSSPLFISIRLDRTNPAEQDPQTLFRPVNNKPFCCPQTPSPVRMGTLAVARFSER
jgi:hypothetical protein